MTTATFRQTVADVAARAKAILPASTNGRLEGAVKLVLAYDVDLQDDGTILVGSCSDPLKTYRLQGTACECKDFTDGKAPQGWCRHRLAAGIMKRVTQELMRATPEEPEVEMPADFEVFPDNDPGPVEEPPPPAPAVPLPEAPASVNVRVTIAGREVQWTLRDTDEARLAERLEALLARYPVQAQTPPAPSQPPAVPHEEQRWCPKHGDKMQLNHKDGRTWHSHKTAEGWCKGK